jgi:hypothetical protein
MLFGTCKISIPPDFDPEKVMFLFRYLFQDLSSSNVFPPLCDVRLYTCSMVPSTNTLDNILSEKELENFILAF